jgi:acyl transferase domain-containing protein
MNIMSPSKEAQEALMRQVYEQAGLSPGETAFVEVCFPSIPFQLPSLLVRTNQKRTNG